LDPRLLGPLAHAIREKFDQGVPLSRFSKVLFLFSDFEQTLDQSLEKFLARPDALEQFRRRALVMGELFRFPQKVSQKTATRFQELVGVIPGYPSRVVSYASKWIGRSDARVDRGLVLLCVLEDSDEAVAALTTVWERLAAEPPDPKLTEGQFGELLGWGERTKELAERVQTHLAVRLARLDSVRFLQSLSDKPLDHREMAKAAFWLTIPATDGVHAAVLQVQPGANELVAGDTTVDWVIEIWERREGIHTGYSAKGPLGQDRMGLDLRPATPNDFPAALREVAEKLDLTWRTDIEGVKSDLRQKKLRLSPKKLVAWLGSSTE
jgi:hypothetical protein